MRKFKLLFVCFGILGLANVATPVFGGTCPANKGSKVKLNALINASQLDHFIWENRAAYTEAKSKDTIAGTSIELKGKLWECGGSEGCKYGYVLKTPSNAVWKGNSVGNRFFFCRDYGDDQWQELEKCSGAEGGYNVAKNSLKQANGGGFYYVKNSGLWCVPDQEHAKCVWNGKKWKDDR